MFVCIRTRNENNKERERRGQGWAALQTVLWGIHRWFRPDPGRRLYPRIYSDENLTEAWHRVRTQGDAPGLDGMTLSQFERRLFLNLKALQRELRAKRYRPHPVKQILIPKADGRLRPVGILTVRDRVVQRAALQILEPLFEPHFEDCSFAFRPNRSVQTALERVAYLVRQGYRWAVDLDIEACFDRINREKLLGFIQERVKDHELLRLLREWLYADRIRVFRSGRRQWVDDRRGLVQGAILSPLLANVYLDRFDKEARQRGLQFVRYADDILILCRTRAEAEQAQQLAGELLARLDLELNPRKTHILPVDRGLRFLGEEVRRWQAREEQLSPQPAPPAGSTLVDWDRLLPCTSSPSAPRGR